MKEFLIEYQSTPYGAKIITPSPQAQQDLGPILKAEAYGFALDCPFLVLTKLSEELLEVVWRDGSVSEIRLNNSTECFTIFLGIRLVLPDGEALLFSPQSKFASSYLIDRSMLDNELFRVNLFLPKDKLKDIRGNILPYLETKEGDILLKVVPLVDTHYQFTYRRTNAQG